MGIIRTLNGIISTHQLGVTTATTISTVFRPIGPSVRMTICYSTIRRHQSVN